MLQSILSAVTGLSLVMPTAPFAASLLHSSPISGGSQVQHAPAKKAVQTRTQLRRQLRTYRSRPQATEMKMSSNYQLYKEGVLGNGQTSVLYFHAEWCTACTDTDNWLRAWYPTDTLLPTYKMNMDDSPVLRKKYGVTVENTFVKIDGKGDKVDLLQAPTGDTLKGFLTR